MSKIKEIANKVNHLKVLYVEDEKDVREESKRFFQRFFSTLVVCEDGEEAWNAFQENSFDLVITDLKMPVMNGNDLMKKVKLKSPNTVTVLMSGISIDLDEDIVADFKLSKPVNFLEFTNFLEAYIQTYCK